LNAPIMMFKNNKGDSNKYKITICAPTNGSRLRIC